MNIGVINDMLGTTNKNDMLILKHLISERPDIKNKLVT